jgi:hypothetical protein
MGWNTLQLNPLWTREGVRERRNERKEGSELENERSDSDMKK